MVQVNAENARLPDEETRSKTTEDVASQKRKASSPTLTPENASPKRQRIDDESEDAPRKNQVNQEADVPTQESDNQDAIREDPAHSDATRPRATLSKEEERRRGKRLFGGLLSTLSQATNGGSQLKRRREIEQRQHEKAQKQRVEEERRLSERRAAINAARQEKQIYFEEKVMKTRHANLLARAHFLQTKAEPRIYYRPWKLTRKQEDDIDDQVAAAKDTISREVEDFEARKEQYDRRHGHSRPDHSKPDHEPRGDERPTETAGPADTDSSAPGPAEVAPAEPPADTANVSPGRSHKGSHDKDHDESGDVVVEGEEDTVMY